MTQSSWFAQLQQLTRTAATQTAAMPRFRMFGHVVSCMDGRCGEWVCGPSPYKWHRILAALVDNRNAQAFQYRFGHDAARATRLGMRQLAVCLTHTDCAYRELRGLKEEDVWKSFRRNCARLLNTYPVWVSLNVTTGAITIMGERDITTLDGSADVPIGDAYCESLLRNAGFQNTDIVHDLSLFLQGNLAYLRGPERFDRHIEDGIVVGSGVPGAATHFSISNRMEHLPEALGIATSVIGRRQVADPYVAVSIAQDPQKPARREQYHSVLRHLRGSVERTLGDLGLAGCYAVHTVLSTKGTGELALAG
ncbi:MAG: hypothetical protein PHI63_01215 [Patescibacteria group bacterium]|nr:hypothetical protein [Patescibacteria group bacterium]